MSRRGGAGVAVALLLLSFIPGTAWPQGVLSRTPNLDDGWVVPAGIIQFNFLHRFEVSPPPFRKVTSFPNFRLATGLPWRFNLALDYATNSTVFTGIPNEYQLSIRRQLLHQQQTGLADIAAVAAYNHASESADGELQLIRTLGPIRLLGSVRGFTNAYDTQDSYWGLGGGAVVRITSWLSLAGDAFSLVNPGDTLTHAVAWGAGAQLRIPYSPHTVSIQVTNTQSGSLEGASRGIKGAHMAGFEFTIPFTLARYFGSKARRPAPSDSTATPAIASALVHIANLAFKADNIRVRPGVPVRWVNDDQVPHSVTATDGSFDSGLLEPGQTYEHTFQRAGAYGYHCTPHPFMRGTVVVTDQ